MYFPHPSTETIIKELHSEYIDLTNLRAIPTEDTGQGLWAYQPRESAKGVLHRFLIAKEVIESEDLEEYLILTREPDLSKFHPHHHTFLRQWLPPKMTKEEFEEHRKAYNILYFKNQ